MYPDGVNFPGLAPWWTAPRLWWLNPGSNYSTPAGERVVKSNSLTLADNEYYRIVRPEIAVDPSSALQITGGQGILQAPLVRYQQANIINPTSMTSGNVPAVGFDTTNSLEAGNNEPSMRNKWLVWNGTTGSGAASGVFRAIEGGGVLPSTITGWVYCWEGLNYDGKGSLNDTLVVQNCRIADATNQQGISWISYYSNTSTLKRGHSGGDVMQNTNGPSFFYIRSLQAVTSYQGIFQQGGAFGTYDMALLDWERVGIKADRGNTATGADGRVPSLGGRTGGQSSLVWDTTRADNAVVRRFGSGDNRVFLDPLPGKTRNQTIYEADRYNTDDAIVIGAAPREFVPLDELVPYNPNDPRWLP